MELAEIIREKICREGPLPFRDFMDMSLYYPEIGYYTRPGEKIGRDGDFYTSPYFTPLFGQLVAKQIEEMYGDLPEGKREAIERRDGKAS